MSRKAFYLAVTFSAAALKGSPHSSQNLRRAGLSRTCKSHKNKLSNKGDCSRCNGAPAETYKEVVMSNYVMELSEEVKTLKIFSAALPVET